MKFNRKVLILGASSDIGLSIMRIYSEKIMKLLLIITKEIKLF